MRNSLAAGAAPASQLSLACRAGCQASPARVYAATRRRAATRSATGQTGFAPGAAEGGRPGPAASHLPRRDQLRPRRRHHLGQERQPGRRSAAVGLRRVRGQQAPEDRHVQADQARRRHGGRDQGSAEGNSQRLRRGIGGGARRRASVRDFSRRLPRSPRREHGGARTAGALHRYANRSVRHGRRDVSAGIDRIGPHDAESFGGVARTPAVPRPQVSSTSRRTSSKSNTRTTRRRRSNACATRCRSRRSRR